METNTNLQGFISTFKKHYAIIGNKFEVNITPPNLFKAKNKTPPDDNLLLFYCESLDLPGLHLMTSPITFYGEPIERPYTKNYEDIELTFLVDGEMQIKQFFDTWITAIIDNTSRNLMYYDDYHTTIQITIKENDADIYTIQLLEAYPKQISPIDMSADSKELMKLRVTFVYKNWINP